jgi:hypothetical protein
VYSLYCKTCKFVQRTSCTNVHVLQYRLYKFTCFTIEAVQIYMSYSTSCANVHVLLCLYRKTCKFVQLVLYDMYICTACTVRHLNWYSLCCKTCNLYSAYCKTWHVLQYRLYTFTCLTIEAVQIYMSYSTSCANLHVLLSRLYKLTCLTMCTACTVRHVNLYSLYCKTCKFVQLVL